MELGVLGLGCWDHGPHSHIRLPLSSSLLPPVLSSVSLPPSPRPPLPSPTSHTHITLLLSARRHMHDIQQDGNTQSKPPLAPSLTAPSLTECTLNPKPQTITHRVLVLDPEPPPPDVARRRLLLPSSCAKLPSALRPRLAKSLAALALPPPGVSGYNSSAVLSADTACVMCVCNRVKPLNCTKHMGARSGMRVGIIIIASQFACFHSLLHHILLSPPPLPPPPPRPRTWLKSLSSSRLYFRLSL